MEASDFCTSMKASAPPKSLQLQNRFTAIKVEGESGATTSKRPGPLSLKSCKTTRRKWQVVMGHSLLWGTEAPVCQPDQTSRETWCLPRARIQDVVEELLKLVWPSDYYHLLLFHMGTNNTARGNLDYIKCDYRALGAVVKGMGTQVAFSSTQPVMEQGVRRRALIGRVSNWLRNWCW